MTTAALQSTKLYSSSLRVEDEKIKDKQDNVENVKDYATKAKKLKIWPSVKVAAKFMMLSTWFAAGVSVMSPFMSYVIVASAPALLITPGYLVVCLGCIVIPPLVGLLFGILAGSVAGVADYWEAKSTQNKGAEFLILKIKKCRENAVIFEKDLATVRKSINVISTKTDDLNNEADRLLKNTDVLTSKPRGEYMVASKPFKHDQYSCPRNKVTDELKVMESSVKRSKAGNNNELLDLLALYKRCFDDVSVKIDENNLHTEQNEEQVLFEVIPATLSY